MQDKSPSQAPVTSVDVYLNVNDMCLSVRSRETETRGLVVEHAQSLVVTDVEFVIQPAGRAKARETGVKNPHAFIRGTRQLSCDSPADPTVPITYDPFEYDSFVRADTERPVSTAETVYASVESGIQATGVEYMDRNA